MYLHLHCIYYEFFQNANVYTTQKSITPETEDRSSALTEQDTTVLPLH